MAYSNWGAFVYKNGQRQKNREDMGVFDEDENKYPTGMRIYANLLKNQGQETPWWKHSHHAVLGDGTIRLAGYKNTVALYHLKENGEVEEVDLTPFIVGQVTANEEDPDYMEDYLDKSYEGDYQGCHFRAHQYDDNMVDLELVEADGSSWTSTCGFEYGAGWMDTEE